jgi:hypothetical protein
MCIRPMEDVLQRLDSLGVEDHGTDEDYSFVAPPPLISTSSTLAGEFGFRDGMDASATGSVTGRLGLLEERRCWWDWSGRCAECKQLVRPMDGIFCVNLRHGRQGQDHHRGACGFYATSYKECKSDASHF